MSLIWIAVATMQLSGTTPTEQAKESNAAPQEVGALSTRVDDLVEVVLPDGTKMVNLDGRFEMTTSMSKNSEGEVSVTCAHAGEVGHKHETESNKAVEPKQ